MKQFLFGLIILLFCAINQLVAQNQADVLEFTRMKTAGQGYTIYFNLIGIAGEDHAETILQELLNEPSIYDGTFFKTPDNKDRFQIFVTDLSITANYVRDIVKSHGADYDFTTVMVNGVIPNLGEQGVSIHSLGSQRTPIIFDDFPQYKDTGDPKNDAQNYRREKLEWINNNPEKYEQLLQEMQENR